MVSGRWEKRKKVKENEGWCVCVKCVGKANKARVLGVVVGPKGRQVQGRVCRGVQVCVCGEWGI